MKEERKQAPRPAAFAASLRSCIFVHMRLCDILKIFGLAALAAVPPSATSLSPALPSSWPVTCEQLIAFDDQSGKMRGEWARQLDNIAALYTSQTGTAINARFYVATPEERTRADRLAQFATVADALDSRLIPHDNMDVQVPDSRSYPDRPRGYSLPYFVIRVHYWYWADHPQQPKCW